MMRRALVPVLPVLIVLAVTMLPAASADPVNVMEVGAYEGSIGASESITFQWVLYNNDSFPYLVTVIPIFAEGGDGIAVTPSESFISLDPGEHRTVEVKLSASQGVSTHHADLRVTFNMTRMDDPSQYMVVERSASMDVTALFERGGTKIFVWDNNLPAPLNTAWGTFIIELLGWIMVASLVHLVLFPLVGRIVKRTRIKVDDQLLRILRTPVLVVVVSFGLLDSLDILGIPADVYVSLWQLYEIVAIMVVAWTSYRIFNDIIIDFAGKWAAKTESGIDDVLVPLLHKAGLLIIPIFAAGAALSVVGIDLTLAVASLGVVGLVVGLAAQHSLGNLFSGILLMLDRPFKVGDVVRLDTGEICRVVKIGLRSTQLHNTFDHDIIILPNDMLANRKVENWSRPDNRHSQGTEVRVAYGTDLEKVHKLLLQVAHEHPDVIKEPGQMPYVRTAKLGESGVDFKVWYWVELKNMWRVASDMRTAVDKKLREEGIEIALPQRVITFNGSPSEEQ